jgi:hypothetical protein
MDGKTIFYLLETNLGDEWSLVGVSSSLPCLSPNDFKISTDPHTNYAIAPALTKNTGKLFATLPNERQYSLHLRIHVIV